MATLLFPGNEPIQIPGKQVASSVTSRKHNRAHRHEIVYMPSIRHFRTVYFDESREMVAYIHESRVMSWTPLE